MDNSCENIGLKNKLEKDGIGTIIEFTSPNTPEQNGQVERSFATLWGRVRAMLNNSGVNPDLRTELWDECAATATKFATCYLKMMEKVPLKSFMEKKANSRKT